MKKQQVELDHGEAAKQEGGGESQGDMGDAARSGRLDGWTAD